jgi:hypothetical protein
MNQRRRGRATGTRSVIGTGVVGAAILVGVLWSSGNLSTVGHALGLTGGAPATSPATWACFWDPTINDDWHDDILCARGLETIRPTLLPGQEFVTEDEMIAAGMAYAATLNAQP